jgi:hypothetical protein
MLNGAQRRRLSTLLGHARGRLLTFLGQARGQPGSLSDASERSSGR